VRPQARLTLALSGGLDSVALLHLLLPLRETYPFQLQAVHVHHGLSPHADDWSDFCTQLCARHGIELAMHRVRIARDDPAGIEAAARRERQRIFATLDSDWLLTAHHRNDQAETVLLQLLRGAGPKGLAAMPEVQRRSDWRAAQLRPLLGVARNELLAFARAQGIEWVEDDSNADVRFRRNALRQQVLPLLDAHFPAVTVTLARAAALQAGATELLDDLARFDAMEAIRDDRLDCAVLVALSRPRARNLLRYFIETRGHAMPSVRRLDEALHQLLTARHDARVCLKLGRAELVRFRGGAYLVPPAPERAGPVHWRGETQLTVPGADVAVQFQTVVGEGLKRSLLESGKVTLGVRQGGERLRLHPGGPHRSLKNLLQERGMPPWRRDRLPLLWCDGKLLWAEGVGLEADALAEPAEPGIVPRSVLG
jgi:tRNA(Ile)-lysidine synthase